MSPGGRPPADDPRTHDAHFRYTAEEDRLVRAAAAEEGKKPAVWAREVAVAEAKRRERRRARAHD